MFSLIETAKENGLNPHAYLAWVFQNAPNMNMRNDIDALECLLPYNAPVHCKVSGRN